VPQYVIVDGELVSKEWAAVIGEMRKDGVHGNVNEGKRTLERQTYFYNCYRCQCCNNGNLAAFPSPFAPHIRVGRIDHAIDFGNDGPVFTWLARNGLNPQRTVRGESWHIEVPAERLRWFAKKHDTDVFDTLPKHVERAVRTLFARRKTVQSRIDDRDEIDSKEEPGKWEARDRKVDKAKAARARSRQKVERMLRRARSDKTKRVLRKALAHG
jgi:hypothetical protein